MPASNGSDEVANKQAQIGKPFGGRRKTPNGEIQFTTVQQFLNLQCPTWTYVELNVRRLHSDRRGKGSGKNDDGSVVHGDRKAAFGGCRLEGGSAVKRRVEVFQGGSVGAAQALGE